jgi:predicted NUDIX family NTP pyrophosphohydrolase
MVTVRRSCSSFGVPPAARALTPPRGRFRRGKPLPRERLIDAARREFEEETACPAPPRLVELGEVVEPSGKRVAVWAADAAWSAAGDEHNGHRPASEIDEVAWFDARRARELLRPGQVPLLTRLERLVKLHN